ncbi:hypothetical protein T492DRAFT_1071845, partial [Pavlovales sp. CCMP2436]
TSPPPAGQPAAGRHTSRGTRTARWAHRHHLRSARSCRAGRATPACGHARAPNGMEHYPARRAPRVRGSLRAGHAPRC